MDYDPRDDKAFDDIMVEYTDRYTDITEGDAINDGAIKVVRDI